MPTYYKLQLVAMDTPEVRELNPLNDQTFAEINRYLACQPPLSPEELCTLALGRMHAQMTDTAEELSQEDIEALQTLPQGFTWQDEVEQHVKYHGHPNYSSIASYLVAPGNWRSCTADMSRPGIKAFWSKKCRSSSRIS
jgi:hypothetical protein